LKEATMTDSESGGQKDAGETPRQEEATSKETLGDLESSETGAASSAPGGALNEGGSAETSTPSPDGAFDSTRDGRAGGSDAGDPM
jgi:hypothetical protein